MPPEDLEKCLDRVAPERYRLDHGKSRGARTIEEIPMDEKPDTTPEMESEIGDDDLENVGGGSVLRIDGTGVAGKSVVGTGIAGMDNNS